MQRIPREHVPRNSHLPALTCDRRIVAYKSVMPEFHPVQCCQCNTYQVLSPLYKQDVASSNVPFGGTCNVVSVDCRSNRSRKLPILHAVCAEPNRASSMYALVMPAVSASAKLLVPYGTAGTPAMYMQHQNAKPCIACRYMQSAARHPM